jgi:hypothetical protein
MSPLHRVDDWLLDKLFQPVANFVTNQTQGIIDAIGLASVCLYGVIISLLVKMGFLYLEQNWVLLFINLLATTGFVIFLYNLYPSLRRKARPGMRNIARLTFFIWRMVNLFFLPQDLFDVTSYFVSQSEVIVTLVMGIAGLLVTISVYFASCDIHLPTAKKTYVFGNLATQGST